MPSAKYMQFCSGVVLVLKPPESLPIYFLDVRVRPPAAFGGGSHYPIELVCVVCIWSLTGAVDGFWSAMTVGWSKIYKNPRSWNRHISSSLYLLNTTDAASCSLTKTFSIYVLAHHPLDWKPIDTTRKIVTSSPIGNTVHGQQPWMSGSRSHSRSTSSVDSFRGSNCRSSSWSNKLPPGAPPESPYTIVNFGWDSWRNSRSSGHRRQRKTRRRRFNTTSTPLTTKWQPCLRSMVPT